jgi:thiol-disulfide isomerase/thioredoxin
MARNIIRTLWEGDKKHVKYLGFFAALSVGLFLFAPSLTLAVEKNEMISIDFSLPSLDGNKRIELKDYKGKPIVINFWASWCGPCREEMPFLERTWKEYKDKGVIFLGINVLDEEKSAKDIINILNISYTNLKDSSGEVANNYGVVGLPVTIFIDKEGRIFRKNYGPFLDEKGEKSFISYVKRIIK